MFSQLFYPGIISGYQNKPFIDTKVINYVHQLESPAVSRNNRKA